jgi:hypothetical protein
MPKEKPIRQQKQKGLTDKELIEKYETGQQPISEMINVLLSKPNPNAPIKVAKRP